MSTLMAHMIPYFPDRERSLAVARGLIDGGTAYLEIQFPFSDPTADGPVIQAACQRALDEGFTVDDGFRFVSEVAEIANHAARSVPIFIMSYASLVVARGVRRFLSDGKDAGAIGFILPDLPYDYDEGVYDAAREIGTSVMPVFVTTADRRRVSLIVEAKRDHRKPYRDRRREHSLPPGTCGIGFESLCRFRYQGSRSGEATRAVRARSDRRDSARRTCDGAGKREPGRDRNRNCDGRP